MFQIYINNIVDVQKQARYAGCAQTLDQCKSTNRQKQPIQ